MVILLFTAQQKCMFTFKTCSGEAEEVIRRTGGTHLVLRSVKGKGKTSHKDFAFPWAVPHSSLQSVIPWKTRAPFTSRPGESSTKSSVHT